MMCADCPALDLSAEQLSEIRGRFPDYQPRAVCCCDQAKLAEAERYLAKERMGPEELLQKKAEIISSEPYRGPPRNRAEKRRAAALARRAHG